MHQQITDLLSAYHDGELSVVQRAKVEAHLRTCASCRERLAQLQALSALLSAYPVEVGATEEFWKRLEPRLPARARTATPATVRVRRTWRPWSLVPPLVLLFSKATAQAVLFVSLVFWGAYSLGFLPGWMDRGLYATTALPGSLAKNVSLIVLSQVLPSPLSSLMDCAVGQPPAAVSGLAGLVAPALIYAIAFGGIAFMYLAWMALWWRGLESVTIGNGD